MTGESRTKLALPKALECLIRGPVAMEEGSSSSDESQALINPYHSISIRYLFIAGPVVARTTSDHA